MAHRSDRPHPGPSTGPIGRRVRRWAATAAVALLATAACGGDGEGRSAPTPAPDPTRSAGPTTGPTAPEEVAEAVPFAALIDVDLDAVGPGEHGDLLRYQPIPPPERGNGHRFRILYRSVTPAGRPTFVTGMLAVPPGEAPDGGWGLVTHAHGSTGLADDCAPSAAPDDVAAAEETLVQAIGRDHGFAVVSTDYEGQGGPGRHPFLNGVSEGRSVLDAARAARQVPGVSLTPTATALAGYSQGGHAILWANQLAPAWAPELDVIGTVAGAPASELDLMATEAARDDPGAVVLYAGLATDEHEDDLDELLTDAGQRVLAGAERSCEGQPDPSLRDAELFTVDPVGAEPWRGLVAANIPGAEPGASPVLIVHGEGDESVPPAHSERLVARLCATGDVVERRAIPDLDHIAGAVPTYEQGIAWLTGLVDGADPASSCPA